MICEGAHFVKLMFCKCNVVILGSLSRLQNYRGVYPKVTQTQSLLICGHANWQHIGESSIEVNKLTNTRENAQKFLNRDFTASCPLFWHKILPQITEVVAVRHGGDDDHSYHEERGSD